MTMRLPQLLSALALLFVAAAPALALPGLHRISACNLTPVYIDTFIFSGSKSTRIDVKAQLRIPPGQCENYRTASSGNTSFYILSRARSDVRLDRLQSYPNYNAFWQGTPYWSGVDGDPIVCYNPVVEGITVAAGAKNCLPQQEAYFVSPVTGHIDGVFSYDVLDFGVCENATELSCQTASREGLANYFAALSGSLESAYKGAGNQRNHNIGVVPFGAGFNAADRNGPFDLGVQVNEALSVTPLQSTVFVRQGDEILFFNGRAIFSREELSYHLLQHGKTNGYNKPYNIVFRRNGLDYEADGYTFFHRGMYSQNFLNSDGTCRLSGLAFVVTALEEASFYTQSTLTCIEEGLSGDYRVNSQCKFERDQVIAALQQFCGGEATWGIILGGFYLPIRGPVDEILRGVPLLKGNRLFAQLGRAAALEGLEESSRTAITLPPGSAAADSIDQIKNNAVFASTIGVGFQLAFPRGLTRWAR
ncbi:MAG: hypothetical protein ABJL72_10880 [Roseobacter sp.]